MSKIISISSLIFILAFGCSATRQGFGVHPPQFTPPAIRAPSSVCDLGLPPEELENSFLKAPMLLKFIEEGGCGEIIKASYLEIIKGPLLLIKNLPAKSAKSSFIFIRDDRSYELLQNELSAGRPIFLRSSGAGFSAIVIDAAEDISARLNQMTQTSPAKPILGISPLMAYDELLHEMFHAKQQYETGASARLVSRLNAIAPRQSEAEKAHLFQLAYRFSMELAAHSYQIEYLKTRSTFRDFELTAIPGSSGRPVIEETPGEAYRDSKIKYNLTAYDPQIEEFNRKIATLRKVKSNANWAESICVILKDYVPSEGPYQFRERFPSCR